MWCAQYRRHGPEGLRLARRPFKVPGAVELDPVSKAARVKDLGLARKRIAELEGKIGQQQVELDFFDEPCGTSGKHAGRATGLACGHLRRNLGDDVTASARRTDNRASLGCNGI